MSIDLINEGRLKIHMVTTWKMVLLEYNHKIHPNEFTCYNIKFENDVQITEMITEMYDIFLHLVEKHSGGVQNYTASNGKDVIDKLDVNSDLLKGCWDSLVEHINNSNDTTQLSDIKASAYVFIGTYIDENAEAINLYIISKKNPVLTFKKGKAKIFTSRQNLIVKANEPLIQFNKTFDAVVHKGILYMINKNCEYIFNLEQTSKKICTRCLDNLADADIINNIEDFRRYSMSQHNPKKFISYSSNIVEKLKEPLNMQRVHVDFKIPIDTVTNKFDLSTPDVAKRFISIICEKTKQNVFDDGFCEVSSSTPLRID